jgi:hypothetical protein
VNRLFFGCYACPAVAPGAPIPDTKLIGQPRGWGVFLRDHDQPATNNHEIIDPIVAQHPLTGQNVRLLVHYVCPNCQ